MNDKRLVPARDQIEALAGHRFAGGDYTVAHWENFLLTECTGATLMPGGMVHPIVLFHLPIVGAGTSIAEMFELGQAESDLSIMIESYDWEFFSPMREELPYQVEGGITSASRCQTDSGDTYDRIQFLFEVFAPDRDPVARSTITWHYTRDML